MSNILSVLPVLLQESKVRYASKTLRDLNDTIVSFNKVVPLSIEDITKKHIINWIKWLDEKGNKKSTIAKKVFFVKVFFDYCCTEKIICENPVKDIYITIPKAVPKVLTLRMINKLRELTKNDITTRTFIEVAFYTAMRKGEILNMRWKDINWDEKLIWIPQSKNYWEGHVPFSKDCEIWLKRYKEYQNVTNEEEFVFQGKRGGRLKYETILDTIQRYGRKAELPFRITIHDFRRSSTTFFAANGASDMFLRRLLRHRNADAIRSYLNDAKANSKDFIA